MSDGGEQATAAGPNPDYRAWADAENVSFTEAANSVRAEIKVAANAADTLSRTVMRHQHQKGAAEDTGEMIANLRLAYRHLEDASMRLGKAIQAHDGGVSVYDRATTVGA